MQIKRLWGLAISLTLFLTGTAAPFPPIAASAASVTVKYYLVENGTEIETTRLQPGLIRTKLTLADDRKGYSLTSALYNADNGQLMDVALGRAQQTAGTFQVDIPVPAPASQYEMKVYVWGNFQELKPVTAVKLLDTNSLLPPSGSQIINDMKAMHPNKQHPRILAVQEDFDRIVRLRETDPFYRGLSRSVLHKSDAIIAQPVSVYEKPDGLRLLTVSRTVLDRVTHLAMAYKLTSEPAYAQRAFDELQAAANFPDWNPVHFLDTAEMSAAFAIGYDWLYDWLSDSQKQTLRTAMISKGLNQVMDDYLDKPRSRTYQWSLPGNVNNWRFVCNGAMAMAALAIADEEAESLCIDVLDYGAENMADAMTLFVPNGEYGEGTVYWDYAMRYLSYYASSLEASAGSDYGITQSPALDQTIYFPVYMTGPAGMFNFHDAAETTIQTPVYLWYAKVFEEPGIAALRKGMLEDSHYNGFPEELLWYDPEMGKQTDRILESYNFSSASDVIALSPANVEEGISGVDIVPTNSARPRGSSAKIWGTGKNTELRSWHFPNADAASSEDMVVYFSIRNEDVHSGAALVMRGYDGAGRAGDYRVVQFVGNRVLLCGEDIGFSYELGKWYDVALYQSLERGFFRLMIKEETAEEWENTYVVSRAPAQINNVEKLNGFHLGILSSAAETVVYVDDFFYGYTDWAYPVLEENSRINEDFNTFTGTLPSEWAVDDITAVPGASMVPVTVDGKPGTSLRLQIENADARRTLYLRHRPFKPYHTARMPVDGRMNLQFKMGYPATGVPKDQHGEVWVVMNFADRNGVSTETAFTSIAFAGGNGIHLLRAGTSGTFQTRPFSFREGELYEFGITYTYDEEPENREFTVSVKDQFGNLYVVPYTGDWTPGMQYLSSIDFVLQAWQGDTPGILLDDYSMNTAEAAGGNLNQYLSLDYQAVGYDNASFRSSWDDDALFAAMHTGKNNGSHSQLDMGTFILDAMGERFFMDLGADDYNLTSNTHTLYRYRAEGHNTVVINPGGEYDQVPDAECQIDYYRSTDEEAFAVSNMGEAYAGSTNVRRGLKLTDHRSAVVVQDEITCADDADIWWFAHTDASIDIAEDGKSAILTKNGKRLWVGMISSGDYRFTARPAAPFPASPSVDGQNPNTGIQKLSIQSTAGTDRIISVAMIPLQNGESAPASIPIYEPLIQW